MSKSNIELIKKLRELTGSPIGDCKKALDSSNQDLETARMLLKKQGLLIGILRGTKTTSQGVVTATTTKEARDKTESDYGTITCLSCETESVAKLDSFIAMAIEIALYTIENDNIVLETLQQEFEKKIGNLMSTIKENINLSYYSHMDGEHISIYNHKTNKLSVLVKFNKKVDEQIGKNVAMQIASMTPLFVDYNDIPQSILDAESKLALDKTKEDEKYKDKSPELIEKISKGRLDKTMDEITLLNQPYTQDNKKTIRQYLESADKNLKVLTFRSFKIG